jgi:hypothetical protein
MRVHDHSSSALERATLTRAGARPIVTASLGESPERLFRETVARATRRPSNPSLD